MRKMIYILGILLFSLTCSNENEPKVEPKSDASLHLVDASQSSLDIPYYGGNYTIYYETDIEETLYSRLAVSIDAGNASWCKVSLDRPSKSINLRISRSSSEKPRDAIVTLGNESVSLLIKVKQQEFISTDIVAQWTKVKIVSGWTADYLSESNKIEKAFDGDVTTFFNSKQGEVQYPYEIKFTVDSKSNVTHLIYYPRGDDGTRWGQFGEFEVWYNTKSNAEFVKAGEFDFEKKLSEPSTANFEKPIDHPKEILLKVFSGFNNRVSIGEIEFYEESTGVYDYMKVFADKACSVLKSGISMKEIEAIPEPFYRNLAKRIFSGTYDAEYRIQKYRPYQHPSFDANALKTSHYSLRDNATGIYCDNLDENLIVFVEDLAGQSVGLNIVDFQEKADEGMTYKLREGVNVIKPAKKGHLYVFYHVDEPFALNPTSEKEKQQLIAKSLKIHIATGRVNGFFDIRKHTNQDWTTLLNNAVSKEIDVLGLHSHVVWTVQDYKDFKTDIVQMTNYIDDLVKHQHEFMGLYQYNRQFKNRHFLRVDYFVPAAYASNYKTVYRNNLYKEVFCSEDGFKRRLWVIGHEVGHTNQTRPGVKWHGTTEVTNNLYALYNQKCVHGEARRLTTGDGRLGYSAGGSDGYDAAFEKIVNAERDWYIGGDNFSSNYIPRLVPFWQLYLYFVEIEQQTHFYHDLYEHFRTSSSSNDEGERQLDFVRTVCNIGKMNMIDFFEKWGFLKPIDLQIDDYGVKRIAMSQTQIDNLKSEILSKGYSKPTIKVHELTDSNYKQFTK